MDVIAERTGMYLQRPSKQMEVYCRGQPISLSVRYLPIQKELKIRPNKSSGLNSPVISFNEF